MAFRQQPVVPRVLTNGPPVFPNHCCKLLSGFTRGAIAVDVGGAAALLAGAVRAILCSVDASLLAVDDEAFAREVRTERRRLQERATARAEEVLGMVNARF